jgi:hypothetical protein
MINETSIALGGLVLMIACILLLDSTLVPAAVWGIVIAVGVGWIWCWWSRRRT